MNINIDFDNEPEIQKLTAEMIDDGYTINSAIIIINLLKLGIEKAETLSNLLPARTLKNLENTIKKYYVTNDDVNIMEVSALIDALNSGVDSKLLFDKKHNCGYLSYAKKIQLAHKDPSVLISPDVEHDFSLNALGLLAKISEMDLKVTDDIKKVLSSPIGITNHEYDKLMTYLKERKNTHIFGEMIDNTSVDDALKYLIIRDRSENLYKMCKNAHLSSPMLSLIHDHSLRCIQNCEKYFDIIVDMDEKTAKKFCYTMETFNNISKDQIKDILELDVDFETKLKFLQAGDSLCTKIDITPLKLLHDSKNFNVVDIHTILMSLNNCEHKDKLIDYINIEIYNNPAVTIGDITEIIEGFVNGIDVTVYLANESGAFNESNKLIIRSILEYNQRNKNKIDINRYVDFEKKWLNNLNFKDYNDIADFLNFDIDLRYIENINNTALCVILSLFRERGLNKDQVLEVLDSCIKTNEYYNDYMISKTALNMFKPYSEKNLYKESLKILKEIEELKKYDNLCKNAIENLLTEDNACSLIKMLKAYTRAGTTLKEEIKDKINNGVFINFSENLNDEQMKEVLYAASRGVFDKHYLISSVEPEKMHMLIDLQVDAKDVKDINRIIDLLLDKNVSVNEVVSIGKYIIDSKMHIPPLFIKKGVPVDKMKYLVPLFNAKDLLDTSPIANFSELRFKIQHKANELFSFLYNERDNSAMAQNEFCKDEFEKFILELSKEEISIDEKNALLTILARIDSKDLIEEFNYEK